MRIGRTLPPAAAPLALRDIFAGLQGLVTGARAEEQARQELQDYFQKKHCFLVSSGKAALTLILLALKDLHPDRDQVLIPAFTCYSVPSAIVRADLKIELCDIDLETLDFDFAQLEEKLKNPRLLCVIPTHLFGLPVDVERLRELKHDPAVTIVEDAAQAMGGEWQGRKLGTQGDIGFFSLGRGKALTAVEGGVIITDDEELGENLHAQVARLPDCSIKQTLNHFLYALALMFLLRPEIFWLPRSLPFLRLGETRFDTSFPVYRLSNFQAGLLRGVQHKLFNLRRVRQGNIKVWFERFPRFRVQNIEKQHGVFPDLLRFPFCTGNRKKADLLLQQSTQLGLGLARTYPDAIQGIPELGKQLAGQDAPNARRAAQEIITLPVHGFLTPRDRELIIRLLAEKETVQEVMA